jgi:hypothetical protein
MAQEGGIQGAFDVATGGLGRAAKWMAPKLAELALNPIESVARKYPDIAETYLKVGKLVMPGKRGGVGAVGKKESTQQARGLRQASVKQTDDLIAKADASGAPRAGGWRPTLELEPLKRQADTLAKAGKADHRPAISDRVNSFMRQNADISNTDANQLRRTLDNAAEQAFAAERRMGPPAGIEAQIDKALAGGLRDQVRRNVPGVEQLTGQTKSLVGLEKALQKAGGRKHWLTRNQAITTSVLGGIGGTAATGGDPWAGIGTGAATAGATYLAMNPRNLGRMALAAKNIGTAGDSAIPPNLLRLALIAALEETPSGETPR